MVRPKRGPQSEDAGASESALAGEKASFAVNQAKKPDYYYECQECGYILRIPQDQTPPACPLCETKGNFLFVVDEVEYEAGFGIIHRNKYAEPILIHKIAEKPGLTEAELKVQLEDKETMRAEFKEYDEEETFNEISNSSYYFDWSPEKLQRALKHLLLRGIIYFKTGPDQQRRYYLKTEP